MSPPEQARPGPFIPVRCPSCGYTLAGLPHRICPECGTHADDAAMNLGRARQLVNASLIGMLILGFVLSATGLFAVIGIPMIITALVLVGTPMPPSRVLRVLLWRILLVLGLLTVTIAAAVIALLRW
jgi:hypothetical protein